MLAKTRPTVKTYHIREGRTYRVRSVKTFKFEVYRVDSDWVQASGRHTLASYRRMQLPCVKVVTVATTLSLNGKTTFLTQMTATGDYADTLDYFGELANVRGCVSCRDRTAIMLTTHI